LYEGLTGGDFDADFDVEGSYVDFDGILSALLKNLS
jgi:hypothetical protein